MQKYRMTIDIEAVQWFKHGDCDAVVRVKTPTAKLKLCHCGSEIGENHGWLHGVALGSFVCPSDWIIKCSDGKYHVCDNETFERKYVRPPDANQNYEWPERNVPKTHKIKTWVEPFGKTWNGLKLWAAEKRFKENTKEKRI